MCIRDSFTPVPHDQFRLGVPLVGEYELLLNTDDQRYNGSGYEVKQSMVTEEVESESQPQSLYLSLPPLATVFYKLK